MYSLFRRYQPHGVVLAVAYWLVVTAATLAVLAVGFYWLDRVLPQGGY